MFKVKQLEKVLVNTHDHTSTGYN